MGDARRRRCTYGTACYRTSAPHRAQFAHAGDADWRDTAGAASTMPQAPSSTKRKAEPSNAVSPGDVVWAKMKGFPAWPAQVESVEARASGSKATVVFICNNDTSPECIERLLLAAPASGPQWEALASASDDAPLAVYNYSSNTIFHTLLPRV